MMFFEEVIAYFGGLEETIFVGVLLCAALLSVLLLGKLIGTTLAFFRWVKGKVAEGRARKKQAKRSLEYTLPRAGNTYVRARLNTTLQEQEEMPAIEGIEMKLSYAEKMLAKVKEAGLSPVERLDVEEFAGALSACRGKSKWTEGDLRSINRLLCKLIKLSAKYEIAV